MNEKFFYAIISAIIVIGGVGIGAIYYHSVSSVSSTGLPQQTSITLVVTSENYYNSTTGTQPAFYILEPNGSLASASNLNLPSHKLISITIVDYDGQGTEANVYSNNPSNITNYANVTGTVGGVEYYYNNTNINSSLSNNISNNITVKGGVLISQVPWVGNSTGGYDLAHTFTILSGGSIILNLPSPGASIVHANIYINQTGTYTWQCYVPCGSATNGWGGAMATAGWMAGQVTVS